MNKTIYLYSSQKSLHYRQKLRSKSQLQVSKILNSTLSYKKQQPSQINIKAQEIQQYKRNRDMQYLIKYFKQKINLMSQLKTEILNQKNNVFYSNVMSQIKYLGVGKPLMRIWDNLDQFLKPTQKMLIDLQNWGRFVFNEDFLKALDTANNIYTYMLTDFKQKKWTTKHKSIKEYQQNNREKMNNINYRLHRIQNKKVKDQFNKTLRELVKQKQIVSTKKHYLRLKSESNDFLVKQSKGCKILRAQIFTQKFYDVGQ